MSEPAMSDDEWNSAMKRGRSARLRVAPDVAARYRFDPEDRRDEREQWAAQVAPMPSISPSARPPGDAIYLLPSDVVAYWLEQIEAAEAVTIVTNGVRYSQLAEDWVTRDGVVIFELRRRNITPEQLDKLIDSNDISLCQITTDWRACEMAASVEGLCESFWWLTPDGVAAYDIEMKWPLVASCDIDELLERRFPIGERVSDLS